MKFKFESTQKQGKIIEINKKIKVATISRPDKGEQVSGLPLDALGDDLSKLKDGFYKIIDSNGLRFEISHKENSVFFPALMKLEIAQVLYKAFVEDTDDDTEDISEEISKIAIENFVVANEEILSFCKSLNGKMDMNEIELLEGKFGGNHACIKSEGSMFVNKLVIMNNETKEFEKYGFQMIYLDWEEELDDYIVYDATNQWYNITLKGYFEMLVLTNPQGVRTDSVMSYY